jgi:hypothetical protein
MHVVTLSTTGAIGRHRRLVIEPLSVTGTIGRHRRSAAVPCLALACGMVNRSPCLESHGDRVASAGPPDAARDKSS